MMPESPFFGPDGRRAIRPEVAEWFEQTCNCTPVSGFERMLSSGGSRENRNRLSGYCETHGNCEWLLSMKAHQGMEWETAEIPHQRASHIGLTLSIGFGNGSPLPQPSGSWTVEINDRFACSIRTVRHSEVWRQDQASFVFSANRHETAVPYHGMTLSNLISDEAFATFGPAMLVVPEAWLEGGKKARIRITPYCEPTSTRWFQLESYSDYLTQTVPYELADLMTEQTFREAGNYRAYFGDIHTHSGQVLTEANNQGCGIGSREDNYRYARGPGALDFYALTDHEFQIDPDNPSDYLGLADKYNEDGRFVCLPAFEFTNLLWGHRNVYFRDSGGTIINANTEAGARPTMDPNQCMHPAQLWEKLEATGVPFMTIPHHPSASSHPMSWEVFNPAYDRLVEVYSVWGSSEYLGDFPRGVSDRWDSLSVREALKSGIQFGMIGSADGHDGHPGNAQSPMVKHHHQFHFCGSGRAVVLSNDLTRHSVFDALHARRCYATTGVPIVMDMNLDEAPMGSELPPLARNTWPRITLNCRGTTGIEEIRIMKNGLPHETIPCHGQRQVNLEWEDSKFNTEEGGCYYVRVLQKDYESAWSSPVWIDPDR